MNGFSFDLNDGFAGVGLQTPADGCTQCGICLPVCPTYSQSGDLEQSPLGRIRMMRALESGQTEGMALQKLDSCLGCYACASSCPSRVDYAQMLDQALERLREQLPLPFITRLMLWLAHQPARIRLLTRAAVIAQSTGLRPLLRRLGVIKLLRLGRADALFARPAYPRTRLRGRLRRPRYDQRVSLFRGCFSSVLEQPLQQTAIEVLNALGIEVVIPQDQVCCGALHRHNGESQTALQMAGKNIQAFNQHPTTAIISTSSGCGASLQEYDRWLGLEGSPFKQPPMDISHYLALVLRQRNVRFNALELKVAIHTPCTQKQHIGQQNAVIELLQMIPGVQLMPLSASPACCGAGGSQLLSDAAQADGLRDRIIDEVINLQPDVLISSNLGCSMHLENGLVSAGHSIPLLHPLQLLQRAMAVELVSVRTG